METCDGNGSGGSGGSGERTGDGGCNTSAAVAVVVATKIGMYGSYPTEFYLHSDFMRPNSE